MTELPMKTLEVTCNWNQFLIGFSWHKIELYEPYYHFLALNLGPLTLIVRLP